MKKRLFLLVLSLALLGVLWWKTSWKELWEVCQTLDAKWLIIALLMFIPQTLLSGWRWSWIVGAYQPLGGWKATELVLASNTLNIVLPSKMGDVIKGLFLRKDLPGGDAATGLALGFFEKGLDTASLAFLMLVATAFVPPTEALGWFLVACGAAGLIVFVLLMTRPFANLIIEKTKKYEQRKGIIAKVLHKFGALGSVILKLRSQPARFWGVMVSAVLLWTLHMAQFSFALWATGGHTDTATLWSRVPMAIFMGLLPLTFAGVGTRDAAMLHLLGPIVGRGVALALGLFATMRYVVVAVAGVPFIMRLPINRSLLFKKPAEARSAMAQAGEDK